MQMPGWLLELDTSALLAINGANDPVLDILFYYISQKWTWIPFYIWILYVLYRNYGRRVLWFLPFIALMITGSDQISTLLKETTERFRPCHEPSIQHLVHLVNNKCGGTYGFVSSHAANSMALAVFIILMLPKGYRDLRIEMIAFALLNGYSRIYLGAHYPLDVAGGFIVGFIMALLTATLLRSVIKIPEKAAQGHE
jgi:undecaprenyl-diphosphatase